MTVVVQSSVQHQPAVAGLVDAVMVAGLPADEALAAGILGIGHEQLTHVRDGAAEARLDVPAGKWRIWPERGVGIWLGDAPTDRLPRIPSNATEHKYDLAESVIRLARNGMYFQDVQLLTTGAWTEVLPATEWMRLLRLPEIDAIAGVLSDGISVGFSVELHRSGLLRAEKPVQADLCFTLVTGLHDS
jgi:hypothetical protein